jgi:hypothetical protein
MKPLFTLILFAALTAATAQCNVRTAPTFLALPSFFGLFLNGHCVSQNMADTTICVKFPPTATGRVAAFSVSSPNGSPAFITSYAQYNEQCVFISNSPLIWPSSDTTTVCYTIQTALIDNFCPYALQVSGLAVEWCGVSATMAGAYIDIRFSTCSNTGTDKFLIQASHDLITWQSFGKVPAQYPNHPDRLNYQVTLPPCIAGEQYIRIVEVDLNGNIQPSEPVFLSVPAPAVTTKGSFDILGRAISADSPYLYRVGN